jgi:hypothetical protein
MRIRQEKPDYCGELSSQACAELMFYITATLSYIYESVATSMALLFDDRSTERSSACMRAVCTCFGPYPYHTRLANQKGSSVWIHLYSNT